MYKFTYLLSSFNRALAFQVTEQSEAVTAFLKSSPFVSKKGWKITTVDQPEIDVTNKTIFVRGKEKENDDKITIVNFGDNSEKGLNINEIREALDEFNVVLLKKTGDYQFNDGLIYSTIVKQRISNFPPYNITLTPPFGIVEYLSYTI